MAHSIYKRGLRHRRGWKKRDVNAPPDEKFVRSGHQSVILVGDHLYIDGGEVSQFSNDDKNVPGPAQRINETLSIPLSQSWTNESVVIRSLNKGDAPSMKSASLWIEGQSNSFYAFGGEASYGRDVPEKRLWKFSADRYGGGSWTQESPANPVTLAMLSRPAGGSSAKSKDTGFILGGWASSWTDQTYQSSNKVSLSGLVSFNMTSKIWANETATPYYSAGTSYLGGAEYVPSYGPNGLILFFGGSTKGTNYEDKVGKSGQLDFNNITLYDPVTKGWHWQFTTGDFPTQREKFCTVGVQGKDSYEIFVFGGYSSRIKSAFDDVYVLSLPGFTWSKANYTPRSPRAFHACALVGKRQMISVGGVNYALNATGCWLDKDPFKRGLGIFDLTAMEWSSQYNASAMPYESPQVVKDWYSQGKLSSVAWTSEVVRGLFTQANNGGLTSNSTNPSQSQTSQTKPPIAAIIGGVVGGVGLLALVVVIVFFFWMRRRNRDDPRTTNTDDLKTSTGAKTPPYSGKDEWDGSYKYQSSCVGINELDPYNDTQRIMEMDSMKPMMELEAPAQQCFELECPKQSNMYNSSVSELGDTQPRIINRE